jgi:hypothetical protein
MGVAAGTQVVLAGMWWGPTWELKMVQCQFFMSIRAGMSGYVVQSCSRAVSCMLGGCRLDQVERVRLHLFDLRFDLRIDELRFFSRSFIQASKGKRQFNHHVYLSLFVSQPHP